MSGQSKFEAWARQRRFQQIAKELVQLEKRRLSFDLNAVVEDPGGALVDHPEVRIQYDSAPPVGCSVYGYYELQPGSQSVIHVHPSSTFARDNFTILHELGHHVQQQHGEWLDARHGVSGATGAIWEERVADAFAAELLIPEEAFESDVAHLSARALASAHASTSASRSAVAMRAIELLEDTQATVVVTDDQGMVVFARSCGGDVFTPSRGMKQAGIASLITEAQGKGGYTVGRIDDLTARSGWAQQELQAEVALDHVGTYAFAVIRPARRYGNRTVWERPQHECTSEACGSVFQADETTAGCKDCDTLVCPDCHSCSCEPEQSPTCPLCGMQYPVAERNDPDLHDCL